MNRRQALKRAFLTAVGVATGAALLGCEKKAEVATPHKHSVDPASLKCKKCAFPVWAGVDFGYDESMTVCMLQDNVAISPAMLGVLGVRYQMPPEKSEEMLRVLRGEFDDREWLESV